MIEVRHLAMIDAIARAGTVTGAARRLHLSQPAVSHALAELESRLGLLLFHRESRGMSITPEGERLLSTARVVLDEVRAVEHDLRLFRDGCSGIVRITTECYTCYHWLPPVLAHFQERLPDVEVQIVADATADPLDALKEGRLDLAVVHQEVDDPELVTEPLFVDELVAAVAPGHRLAHRAHLEPEDFEGEVLLLHADPERSTILTDVLGPAGVRPARVLALQLTEAVLASVQAGFGITAMATWALRPALDEGTVVGLRIGSEGLRREWRLATRRDRAGRATVQELARVLKEERLFPAVSGTSRTV